MSAFLMAGEIGAWLDTTFAAFDLSIFSILGNIQNEMFNFLAKFFTSMGEPVYIILLGVIGALFCLHKKTRKIGLAMVFAIVIGTVLANVLIKPFVARIRPYNTLQNNAEYWSWYVGAGMLSESDYCFPSGHTTAATEISVALFLCHLKSKRKSARAVCWLFPLVALAVAVSRIYLMVHYASDVVGGIILGIIAGVSGYLISNLIPRISNVSSDEMQLKPDDNIRSGMIVTLVVAWLIIVCISFNKVLISGGSDAIRCSYSEEYNCQNEAETDSDYPPINGDYYCKMHWKELSD